MNSEYRRKLPKIKKNTAVDQVATLAKREEKCRLRAKPKVRAIVRESHELKEKNFQIISENLSHQVPEKFKWLTEEVVNFPKDSKAQVENNIDLPQENCLNEPKLLTSCSIIRNIEKLKEIELQTQNMLNLVTLKKNSDIGKSQSSKVFSVLNKNPCDLIFSRLQPISFNVHYLTKSSTEKLSHLAEKYAPPKSVKDPTIVLKDYLNSITISKIPILPNSSFLKQCHQFQINPFSQCIVTNTNRCCSYVLTCN